MSARLVFLRRTAEELEAIGGEIYFDINGKNIGKLAMSDCNVDLPAGTYKLRMYKSHGYGAMAGFAETVVSVGEGEALLIRYNPPAVVNQSGHIMVSEYSRAAADAAACENAARINDERAESAEKARQRDRSSQNVIKWIIITAVLATVGLMVLSAAIYLLVMLPIMF